ncbi:hypothetical protein [Fluviicola taffensis]|uniref:hypothetical protein n=1 Tax=Fluviicola taffensis TaxID=191579 RepID=UPI00313815CC
MLMLLSNYSFSQKNDSVPPKTYKAFFGCDCCQDTVMMRIPFQRKCMYECTLYKSQHLLQVKDMGKVIWEKDIRTYLQNKQENELCIFNGGLDAKGRERIIVSNGSKALVVLYLKNGKQVKQSKK